MNYENICAENRKLYEDMEAITYALMELDQVRDAAQYQLLINEREYIKMLVDQNLYILFQSIPNKKFDSIRTTRQAERVKRDLMKGKVLSYYNKHHSSMKEMSGVFGISIYQISRYITEHLAQKHAF